MGDTSDEEFLGWATTLTGPAGRVGVLLWAPGEAEEQLGVKDPVTGFISEAALDSVGCPEVVSNGTSYSTIRPGCLRELAREREERWKGDFVEAAPPPHPASWLTTGLEGISSEEEGEEEVVQQPLKIQRGM